MLQAAANDRRARHVLAPPDDFLFVAMQMTATHWACRWHHPGVAARHTLLQDGLYDLGDDVAALLDENPIGFAQILPRDILGIVQRRHRDGRARKEYRLE